MKYVAVAAALVSLIAGASTARAGAVTVFRCSNPASGANWEIKVDYDRNLVDSFPAAISDRWISWDDAVNGGHYDLDRATGALTVRNASSTGGYFLYDKCRTTKAGSDDRRPG